MGNASSPPVRRGAREFLPHELAFVFLGSATLLATRWRSGSFAGVPLEVGAATALYAGFVVGLRRGSAVAQKIRLLAAYGFMAWFYFAVARIVPALAMPVRDGTLCDLDRVLFHETPAVYCQAWTAPWLTDLLSGCYLCFHAYLALAVAHLLWRPVDAGVRLSVSVYTAYAVGFVGYLLVPALGPWRAFPHLFTTPLTGGVVTELNARIVAQGSSVYDVFPSLHVLITLVLLNHDWREVRRRFWVMVLPAIGLIVATIYLRYHYAVDLLAGGALFLILHWTLRRWTACPDHDTVRAGRGEA